jgi:hypothetical protein
MHIIRGNEPETYKEFKDRIIDLMHDAENKIPKAVISMTLTEDPPPRFSVIPFRKGKIAVVSMISDLPHPEDLLIHAVGYSGSYQVTEALPVAYSKNWPDSQRTPGICLLTLFKKKKSIDYETFLHRWHNSHTPLSLKIHPLWHYNRNVVDSWVIAASEEWDGIVEEHFRKRQHLTNPFIFFGNPLTMWYHMIQVYADTNSFLDYHTIETYLVQEYIMKST